MNGNSQGRFTKRKIVPHPVAFCDHMVGSVDNSGAVYVVYLGLGRHLT